MKAITHFSLEKLLAAAEGQLPDRDVVSFDIFDTLLVRRIHDPDLVKLPVARYIAALACARGRVYSWRQVQERRDAIERRHRLETAEKFVDHEACYPRFIEELLREVFAEAYQPQLLDQVTDYELAMENSMLVPRQEFVTWLPRLRQAGKRLLAISDMYLPADHLQRLLRHAGIADYFTAVFSSADTFLAKASGLAYPLIAEKLQITPSRWLHIGDNPISDGLRAIEAGLAALLIDDTGERQRRSITKRYYNYSDGRPFWRGRILQQVMAPLEAENRQVPPLYIEGYNFVGPLVGLFVQQIAEICRQEGIGKVFFFSREGWTFKRYWEEAMPLLYPDGELPEIEYLYASRMALAGAACAYQGLTQTNADIAFLPAGNRDFRDLCRIFSLDSDRFSALLAAHRLTAETVLSHIHDGYQAEHRRRFEELVSDPLFQEEVRRQTLPANEALQRYLAEIGFFNFPRVAIVDIGWLGTIQRFLYEAVAHREDCPVCSGYLFGATRGIPYPTSAKNSVTGLIYDRDRFDLAASTLFYARDIFEEACRAPHPTLNGYALDGESYKLVFRQTADEIGQAELAQDSYFAPLQQGIFDSARRFGAAAALLGFSFADCKPWLNYLLLTKLAFPRTGEVAEIRNRHHLDDFHGSKKPKAEFFRHAGQLWEHSLAALRFRPLLRLRYYLRHIRERINE